MNIDGHRQDNSCCFFHQKEVFVGVCPLCLNERLLILAAKQRHHRLSSSATGLGCGRHGSKAQGFALRKPLLNLSKIFALGPLLNRLELRHSKSDPSDYVPGASTGPQDGPFISIKFGDNGVASWERGTVSKMSLERRGKKSRDNDFNKETKEPNEDTVGSVSGTEHAKPRGLLLRWRKPMGHLFHFIKWKRRSKGDVEGVNARKSWIRTTPTKRGTSECVYIERGR